VVLEKPEKELAGTIKSLNIIQKITEVGRNLRGKGRTKDLNRKRRSSELHSRRNGLKMELV